MSRSRYHREPERESRYRQEAERENRYRQEAERRNRYRQEGLENDWQQSWDRMPAGEEEQKVTPFQYVLIGFTVVLLIVLIMFGVFWTMGRSTKKSETDRNGGRNTSAQTDGPTGTVEEPITILNEGMSEETEGGTQNIQYLLQKMGL